ncbi:hypothetical protein D2Q93_10745 [Alicyclobacillaceae bacterium I2511]|nr:hypothetical protein D2Q93_10745 [Alicyclobacillaceae bacterium I2511]
MGKHSHAHWEIRSICPRCEKPNFVHVPVGERVVQIHCQHCAHGYEYIHVVQHPRYVEDSEESS